MKNPVNICRLLRLNQYRNLTRKAEEKVYLRNDKKDPDRLSVRERGLKSTLFWVGIVSGGRVVVVNVSMLQSCEECSEEFCHGGCMKFEYEKHKVILK